MSKTLKFSYREGSRMIKESCPYYEVLLKDDENNEDVKDTTRIGSAACSACIYHKAINMVEKAVKCTADEFMPKPILPSPLVYPTNNNIFRKAILRRIKC